ncbi:hypothetical protein Val02_76690 [Virgisporangium aliadipatigenens]|uniref:SWIM-type domain-containing protein n=1 Tax=Virgisporangium aliadipatigenens TaxID=741659 RepID=A0A8J3YW45_9ACTN|nr:SWIM zinc finger family protein [Virgisporangium aliadipatigenens]GIJ50783.1 hypothetical protein Val02_76690 [Virgisporangium aliadipatigenens]
MAEVEVPRWSPEQVLALAPDASAGRAAQSLAGDSGWSDEGWDEADAVWGRCRGRGTYQIVVDLSGPAFRCTCPSRKVPCKHAVGLLLRWSDARVKPDLPPQWADAWMAARAARAARRSTAAPRTVNPKTVAKRAEQVEAGLAELDRWLTDQVRAGVAGLATAGYEPFDLQAARLVDAKAPGAAAMVRRLAAAAVSGVPERLVTELGLLRLLVRGFLRRAELPAELAATVAARVGIQVRTEDVLATAPVADTWAVLGVRDEIDEQLSTRRAWLRGNATGRPALVMSFAGPGQPLVGDFVPGTAFPGELCFYPGAAPLRALVKTRGEQTGGKPEGVGIQQALDEWATALAGDPWTDRWPVLLDGVVPTRTHLIDAAGDALPLLGEPWDLVAAAGGRPCRVFGEYGLSGVRVLTAWVEGRVVVL